MRADGLMHATALTHDDLRRRLAAAGHLSIRRRLTLLIALILIPRRLSLTVAMTLALKILIRIGPLLIPAALVDQPIIVLCMLKIVLSRDSVARGLGIARQGDVFL